MKVSGTASPVILTRGFGVLSASENICSISWNLGSLLGRSTGEAVLAKLLFDKENPDLGSQDSSSNIWNPIATSCLVRNKGKCLYQNFINLFYVVSLHISPQMHLLSLFLCINIILAISLLWFSHGGMDPCQHHQHHLCRWGKETKSYWSYTAPLSKAMGGGEIERHLWFAMTRRRRGEVNSFWPE